jgi:ABC-type thiamin/hydroxymethylpyrimidine transport system permease subunit
LLEDVLRICSLSALHSQVLFGIQLSGAISGPMVFAKTGKINKASVMAAKTSTVLLHNSLIYNAFLMPIQGIGLYLYYPCEFIAIPERGI